MVSEYYKEMASKLQAIWIISFIRNDSVTNRYDRLITSWKQKYELREKFNDQELAEKKYENNPIYSHLK